MCSGRVMLVDFPQVSGLPFATFGAVRGEISPRAAAGVTHLLLGHVAKSKEGTLCEARSATGPLAEIHDASMPGGHAALPLTATAADQDGASGHDAAPATVAPGGDWMGALVGIASEWSSHFPGYVAGAIDAADHGVRHALAILAAGEGSTP